MRKIADDQKTVFETVWRVNSNYVHAIENGCDAETQMQLLGFCEEAIELLINRGWLIDYSEFAEKKLIERMKDRVEVIA